MERVNKGVVCPAFDKRRHWHRDSSVITIPPALHADESDNQGFLTLAIQAAFTFPGLFLQLIKCRRVYSHFVLWQNGKK